MKKKIIKFVSIFSFLALSPIFAFAAGSGSCDALTGLGKIICQIGQLFNAIIPVMVSLGMVYFIWGVIKYVIADGEEEKKKGKDVMIYGIIGFAVIVGLWGIVNVIITSFDLGGASTFPQGAAGAAAGTCRLITGAKFQDLLSYITCIIAGSVIPLIFAGAAVMFIWGVVNFFIINANEEAKRAQGRQFMIWGIIALAVMLSVWGLVGILGSTFGLNTSVLPTVTPPGASGGGGASCGGATYGSCSGGQSCTGTSPNYTCSTID